VEKEIKTIYMTFCAIIPDRNDRKELTEHCLWQLSRMTIKPDKIYHMNYQPESERFDLTERIRRGWLKAKYDNIEWCFIIENDDFYPADYFERYFTKAKNCCTNVDMMGDNKTTYYHIKNNTWTEFDHPGRSSLFTTAFKTSVFIDYHWPSNNSPFLDIKLWEYAERFDIPRLYLQSNAIGIKHGVGVCGGKGHKMTFKNTDPDLQYLNKITDKESFEFYKALQL
jgi:hypothetical protein